MGTLADYIYTIPPPMLLIVRQPPRFSFEKRIGPKVQPSSDSPEKVLYQVDDIPFLMRIFADRHQFWQVLNHK